MLASFVRTEVRLVAEGAMFLGETSFCVSTGGETEIIANRVDYQHDGVPEFQTLDLCSFDEYDSRAMII